jgi:hypothetical protein
MTEVSEFPFANHQPEELATATDTANSLEALQLLVAFQLAEEQWADAILSLQQLMQHQPNEPELHATLGAVQLELGQVEAAIHSYATAYALQPNFPQPYLDLLQQWLDTNQFASAIPLAIRLLQVNPVLDQAYLAIGYALQQLEIYPAAAHRCLTGLLDAEIIQTFLPGEAIAAIHPPLTQLESFSNPDGIHYHLLRPGTTLVPTPPPPPDAGELHPAFVNHTVSVLPAYLVTLTQGRVWADDYTRAVFTQTRQLVKNASVGNAELIASSQWLPPPIGHTGRVASLTIRDSHNYFHWMYDLLPKLELLEQAGYPLSSIDVFWVNRCQYPFQRQLLNRMGIADSQIVDSFTLHSVAETLLVPVASPSFAAGRIAEQTCHYLRQKLLTPAQLHPPQSPSQRIYISRKLANYRKVANEAEFWPSLQRLGFTEVCLEHYSVEQQIDLFASAEAIVAPHGAGLSNIVFAQPGSKLIEIFAKDEVLDYYWLISHYVGVDYHYVLAGSTEASVQPVVAGDGRITRLATLADLVVPAAELLALLQRLGLEPRSPIPNPTH